MCQVLQQLLGLHSGSRNYWTRPINRQLDDLIWGSGTQRRMTNLLGVMEVLGGFPWESHLSRENE